MNLINLNLFFFFGGGVWTPLIPHFPLDLDMHIYIKIYLSDLLQMKIFMNYLTFIFIMIFSIIFVIRWCTIENITTIFLLVNIFSSLNFDLKNNCVLITAMQYSSAIILQTYANNMTWNWTLSSQFKIVHWNSKFFLTFYFWNLNCKKIYSRMPFANLLRNLRWPKRNGKTQQQWFRHGTSKLWWNYRWPIPGRLMKSNQCEHCIFSLYVQQFLCNSCCLCLS